MSRAHQTALFQAHIVLLHCVCVCAHACVACVVYQKAMTQSLVVPHSVESGLVTPLILMDSSSVAACWPCPCSSTGK